MSKEKKNRFYYSKNQNEIDEEMWNMPTRFTFVKTPDGWKQYSEWCSVKGVKCNWEDAELVYETDDEPEIIVHEGIPEFINDLEAKLAESEEEIKNIQQVSDKYYGLYKEKFNRIFELAKENNDLKHQLAEYDSELAENVRENECLKDEIHKLKQQLAEKDKQIETILKENEKLVKKHNVYTWGDEIQQDKIYAITGEALEFLINNQDKISFAVEKLEKARSLLFDAPYEFDSEEWCWVEEQLDNQIKQLKEQE